jgi:2'-5' RNA ligase
MTFAIVAYPTLEQRDREWIESFRAHHDPQASWVRPHFTLVFPAEVLRETIVAEASQVLSRQGPLPFAVRRAAAYRDPVGEGGHVFLVPDEGRDEIVALHDRLYEGGLRPYLRADIPFVPHITVGAGATFEECERLAERLNEAHPVFLGTIENVEVLEVKVGEARCVMAFRLPHG